MTSISPYLRPLGNWISLASGPSAGVLACEFRERLAAQEGCGEARRHSHPQARTPALQLIVAH